MPSLPVIVFIPCSSEKCKPGEWLPKLCPGCGERAIIGHGRRRRQAHDRFHSWIRIRRGICRHCRRTLTVLPVYCIPGAQYSLEARREAMANLAAGQTPEEAAPDCRDPDRIAHFSTIRRWAWRRIVSLLAGTSRILFCTPTLLAWDFRAARRILIMEPPPP